jgi:hypothetical protein
MLPTEQVAATHVTHASDSNPQDASASSYLLTSASNMCSNPYENCCKNQNPPTWAPSHSLHRLATRADAAYTRSCGHIPQPHCLVPRGSSKEAPIRVPTCCVHVFNVTWQGVHGGSCSVLQHLQCSVFLPHLQCSVKHCASMLPPGTLFTCCIQIFYAGTKHQALVLPPKRSRSRLLHLWLLLSHKGSAKLSEPSSPSPIPATHGSRG